MAVLLGHNNLILTPLSFEDLLDEAPASMATSKAPNPADPLRLIRNLPSPTRASPLVSPLGPVSSPLGLALSPQAGPSPRVQRWALSSACPTPTQSAAEQITALQARCQKAEHLHMEAEARIAALEQQLKDTAALPQELPAEPNSDAKARALWKAAESAVGTTKAWEVVQVQHDEWLAEAQSNLEERHIAQVWRLLRENFSVEVLSGVARAVGEGAVCAGRLLFDATSSQTASVQKSMGASQTTLQGVLERRHSNGRSVSRGHLVAPAASPEKPPVRAASRACFPPRARAPAAVESQVRQPQIPLSPVGQPAKTIVVSQSPLSPTGMPIETPIRKLAAFSPAGVSPTDGPAHGRIPQPPSTAAATATSRQRTQSASIRDRMQMFESSNRLR